MSGPINYGFHVDLPPNNNTEPRQNAFQKSYSQVAHHWTLSPMVPLALNITFKSKCSFDFSRIQVPQKLMIFPSKIPLLKWQSTFYSLLCPFGKSCVLTRLPSNHLGTEWMHAFNCWPQHPQSRIALRFSSHNHRASFVLCIREAVRHHPKGFPNVLSTHQSEGLEADYNLCLCKQKRCTLVTPLQWSHESKGLSPLSLWHWHFQRRG